MFTVVNHFETGQEYMSRYMAIDPEADVRGWQPRLRLKGIDVTVYAHQLFRALGKIAGDLGRTGDEAEWRALATRSGDAITGHMWSPEARLFTDVDGRTLAPAEGRSLDSGVTGADRGFMDGSNGADGPVRTNVKAAVGFYPMLTGLVDDARLDAMMDHLEDPRTFGTPFRCPPPASTTPASRPRGSGAGKRRNCPWNGRVWPMTTSHVIEGLLRRRRRGNERAGALAAGILVRFVRMMFTGGDPGRPNSFEHYNPYTGPRLPLPRHRRLPALVGAGPAGAGHRRASHRRRRGRGVAPAARVAVREAGAGSHPRARRIGGGGRGTGHAAGGCGAVRRVACAASAGGLGRDGGTRAAGRAMTRGPRGVVLEGVTRRFGRVTAVDSVDLEARPGELMVLVGPSGCGKSTLLRLIAGLEEPDAGEVWIGGRPVNHVAPGDRDVAMVFQSYALYPHMTVARNLGFGLRVRGVGRDDTAERVGRVAEVLGLAELLGRRPGQLSGGQQQRVALGRAMVRDPGVFLFDEPLSNLDAGLRLRTRDEIAALHRRLGTTMIFVTHDQVEALSLGQRVAVMDRGRIQQVGTPREIYRRPGNLFVAGFVGSPPINLLRLTRNRNGHLAGGPFVFPGESPPPHRHARRPPRGSHRHDDVTAHPHPPTRYIRHIARHLGVPTGHPGHPTRPLPAPTTPPHRHRPARRIARRRAARPPRRPARRGLGCTHPPHPSRRSRRHRPRRGRLGPHPPLRPGRRPRGDGARAHRDR